MQKTKDSHQPPNIRIAVENFGPIEKAEVDLRPLTVFVGESNTGKTYLSALIYALYQTFTGMTADFLKQIINYDEHRLPSDEMSGIAAVLENEVLRGEIEVRRPAGGYPDFRYRPQSAEQALRMSHSSSMVSELAPLVLFLRGIVRTGDTLIIEEPEAHLHPKAQTLIALTLARLVRVGVRVIITTHSDWLLEQIGNLIREGEVMKLGKNKTEPTTWLTKEEVGAWWFQTDKPVTEIPFDCIEGIEPKDYYDVAEELHNNAVEFQQHLLNEEEFSSDR